VDSRLADATWRKSTRSDGGQNCVEVAVATGLVGVRDTKDRNGPTLAFGPGAWQTFLQGLGQARFLP
jgi:hypothetical protein